MAFLSPLLVLFSQVESLYSLVYQALDFISNKKYVKLFFGGGRGFPFLLEPSGFPHKIPSFSLTCCSNLVIATWIFKNLV